MTPQEIFDKAYQGVITQGALSKQGATCLYAGPHSTACGVGQLLTPELRVRLDAQVDRDNVSSAIGASFRRNPSIFPDWVGPNLTLLEEIQGAHDRAKDIPAWTTRMSQVAQEFNLTFNPTPTP